LDDDPAEILIGSLSFDDLRIGNFVIFINKQKWVDPALFWLVGRLEQVELKSGMVTIWVWGSAS
jgi:hypothetical protein